MTSKRRDEQHSRRRYNNTTRFLSCSTGKVPIPAQHLIAVHAHAFARDLNEAGQLAPNLYSYRCGSCRHWHLTKAALGPHGAVNSLAFTAAPEALQRWAMTGESPLEPLH